MALVQENAAILVKDNEANEKLVDKTQNPQWKTEGLEILADELISEAIT